MKAAFLSLAAVLCIATSASAQNEVPSAPDNKIPTEQDNVYAPTRMDRQNSNPIETEKYSESNGQNVVTSPATTPENNAATQTQPATNRTNGARLNAKPTTAPATSPKARKR